MMFSLMVPEYIDNTGNIANTKVNLKKLSHVKNFELDDLPSYLLSSSFTDEELSEYIRKTKRNICVFQHDTVQQGHYVEAAIIFPFELKENKYTTDDNSLVVIRRRKEGESQIMIKSDSLKTLFGELDTYLN